MNKRIDYLIYTKNQLRQPKYKNCERNCMRKYLVAERQTAHTRHHAEHVVVGGIHTHRGAGYSAHRVVGDGQQQRGVINAGQIARAAGLVLLRLQSERVHVDTHGRHVGVVLVGLYLVEVATLAHGEAIVTVQLQQSRHYRVVASHALHAGDAVARVLE